MSEILCIGTNDATMITRRAILERAGHAVTPVQDFLEIVKACQARNFDVAILSHTLPIIEKRSISANLGQTCPKTKLLELHVGIAPELPTVDGHLQVTTSQPAELMKAVKVLCRSHRGRDSQAATDDLKPIHGPKVLPSLRHL